MLTKGRQIEPQIQITSVNISDINIYVTTFHPQANVNYMLPYKRMNYIEMKTEYL